MNRILLWAAGCAFAAGLGLVLWSPAGHAQEEARGKPKAIVLGFDGADAALTRRWMDEGVLPNMRRLAETGTFSPLQTSNSAQSPVSWAVIETGSNPGKTNIPDFVRRYFGKDGVPGASIVGVENKPVDAKDVAQHIQGLGPFDRALLALADPTTGRVVLALFALGVFLLVTLIFKVAFRMRLWASVVFGLLFAGGGAYAGHLGLKEVPTGYEVPIAEMKGERFWDVLGRAGVRFTGLQVPAAYPAVAAENVKLLAGLFTPDVRGGPGSWYVYSNDEWELNDSDISSGGTMFKLYADDDGVIRHTLRGPDDFAREHAFRSELARLAARIAEPALADTEKNELERRKDELQREFGAWSRNERKLSLPIEIRPDFAGRKLELSIDGDTQTIAEGGWSDWFRLTFEVTRLLKVHAITRVCVEECRVEEGDERLRLFVPPLNISPEEQPLMWPISAPRSFAGELASAAGLYDTVGWACYTNGLKESELSEQAFMDGQEFVMGWRTKLLNSELDGKDWDVLFHLESTTDRIGHMTYGYMDPEHPQYGEKDKTGNLVRDKDVKAWGRTFPLSDAVKETYREMDRLVGDVVKRIESGEFGDDVTLLVISDHGFQPYRYGVNLNVWLHKNGYLALDEGADPKKDYSLRDYDWSRTRAYSMGLGKIYINMVRPGAGDKDANKGVVAPAERDALVDEICARLLTYTDPTHGGARVIRSAIPAEDLYTGDYVAECGDIVVGMEAGYRVDWNVSGGSYDGATFETDGISTNDKRWNGDHVGVDPELVKGILFSNRKLKLDREPDLTHIAPTVVALFGLERPAEWDGVPLPLE